MTDAPLAFVAGCAALARALERGEIDRERLEFLAAIARTLLAALENEL